MAGKSGWAKLSDAERDSRAQSNRFERMRRIDEMPAELRNLVNDFGLSVVNACIELGVTKPRQIKHLVGVVLDEFSPTRGSFSRQGKRTDVTTPTTPENGNG